MDKDLDYEIYRDAEVQLRYEDDRLSQRKILHTRILKLSLERSTSSSGEIGRLSLESGQFQKSLLQLKRASIIEPDSEFVKIQLARAFFKLEKENDAFSELKRALFLNPSYQTPHQVIITKFQERERLEGIDSFYNEAANMFTDTKSVAYLYYASAKALVRSNEYPKAFEMYRKAFETHSLSSGDHYEYGMTLYHEGLFEEAIVQFEHVKRLDPTNNIAFNNAAHLQYCLGRLQKASEEFEYIIENGLESAGTYSNFILVLHHMDKDEEEINRYKDIFLQNLGENGPTLQSMYGEALRITQTFLKRDESDEETREFNAKKMKGLNLVLSYLN